MENGVSRAKRSGWKRTVLLVAAGCLAVAVATVVVGVGALLWARSVAEGLGDPTPVPVTRTVTLPPERLPVIRAGMTSASEGHRLEVELQDGRFEVVAGEPGGTIEINGEIAGNYYELVEERAGTDGGGPVTAIRLRPTTNSLVRMMASLGGSGPSAQVNRLTVTIPPHRQIALVLRVARGESRIDLGGLMLSDLDAELSMGQHRLRFGAPLAAEISHVRIDGSMGDIELEGLGNARARTLSASSRMGSFTVDLSGAWREEGVSEVTLEHAMGELRLRIPTSVRLSPESCASTRFGETDQIDRRGETADTRMPVVRLDVSTLMGETRISRIDTSASDELEAGTSGRPIPAPAR